MQENRCWEKGHLSFTPVLAREREGGKEKVEGKGGGSVGVKTLFSFFFKVVGSLCFLIYFLCLC